MRWSKVSCSAVLAVALMFGGSAQAASVSVEEAAIRGVLSSQVSAWNSGKIETFMLGYLNSPETTFVGKTVEHGYAGILARYRRKYATPGQMGHLKFEGLEVRVLDADTATVTGHFHLSRSPTDGGDAEGIFSLVFEKTEDGWRIVLDHTS